MVLDRVVLGGVRWAEIDLGRTDVFTPALAASLPAGAEGAAMQKEIERIARSLTVTKEIK